MAYDASVKFNSQVAEKRVEQFARSIGGLRARLRDAATAAKSFGGAVKSQTSDVNHASRRVRVLTNDYDKLAKSARSARTDVLALSRAFNSAGMRAARGSISAASAATGTLARSSQRAATSARGHATAAQRAAAATGTYARQNRTATQSVNALNANVMRLNKSLFSSASELVRFRNLSVFLAGGFGVAFLVETADTAKLVAARLNIVAESEQNLIHLERQLYDVSVRTRSGYKENAALFTKLAMAGKAYGVSQNTSLQVTENVAKAMKISGASASEAAAATQQLSQAFSSGRIQGDELRSVLENSPRLAQALATELSDLGINLGNIRDKASEGAIGITELVRAFGGEGITKQLTEEFKLIPLTIGDSLTVAKTKFTQFISELDKATGISSGVANTIVLLADNFDKLAVAVGLAAFVITTRYVPALVSAIKFSKLFVLFNFATYGAGVRGAFTNMASSVGLFSGVLKKNASSTLPAWRQVAGNVFGAVSLNAKSLFDVFRATFGRIPVVFATVTAAMYIFGGKQKVIAGELATVNDYIVTGFQIAGEKIGAAMSWIGDKISSVVSFAVDLVIGLIDRMVRAGSAAVAFGRSLVTDGVFGGKAIEAAGQAYSTGGIGDYFDSATKGSEWRRRANERARSRGAGGSGSTSGDSTVAPSGGGSKNKDGKDKASSEIDSIRSALESLRGTFSDVEKSRSEYNSGMETLNKSLEYGLVNLTEYKMLSQDLAKEIFPGLTGAMKDLEKENKKLDLELSGASSGQIKFEEGVADLKEQIDTIDKIIAKQGDVSGVLKEQRAVLVGQIRAYGGLIEANDALTTAAEKRKKREEEITKLIDEASNRLYEMLTNRISDALDFSKNSFKNFWKEVFGFAKDSTASVLGAYVFEPIRQKFREELESAFKQTEATTSKIKPGSTWSSIISKAVNDNGTAATDDLVSTGEGEIVVSGSSSFFKELANGYKDGFAGLISGLKTVFRGLEKTFDGLGINMRQLGFDLGKVLANAQIGSLAASAAGGSSTGGAIGGAIGGKLGEKFLSKGLEGIAKGLGDFAGPLGSIAGGLLGGVVGKLLTKTKYGTSVVTGGGEGDVSTLGNSAARRKASVGSANSIQSGVRDIADRLGGDVGTFRVSIGKVNDDFRVSSTGRSGKLKKKYSDVTNFGEDEGGAVAFAIKKAIEQGAITGLRNSTQALLKAGDDLEAALQDALDFEGVFSKLEQMTDPVKYAFKELSKEYERLIELFKDAGATSEEWTQLGQLFQKEISETIKSEIEGLVEFRDDLLGGDRSFRSPTDRLGIADLKFKELEDRVGRGEFVDQDDFTTAGQALQELARQVYGSTPKFQEYQQRLLDATNKLIDNAQSEEDTLKPVVDAINAQGQVAKSGADTTNQLLQQIANNSGGEALDPAKNFLDYRINPDKYRRANGF